MARAKRPNRDSIPPPDSLAPVAAFLDAVESGAFAAQAEAAHTLSRMVERGLLEPHHRYGWYLTEAGLRWCAAWVDEEEVA